MTATHAPRRAAPVHINAIPLPDFSNELAVMYERLAAGRDGRTFEPMHIVVREADVHLRYLDVRNAVEQFVKCGRLANVHVEIRGFHQAPMIEDLGFSTLLRPMIAGGYPHITYRALYPLGDIAQEELVGGRTRVYDLDTQGKRRGRAETGLFIAWFPPLLDRVVEYFENTSTSTPSWSGVTTLGIIAAAVRDRVRESLTDVHTALRRRPDMFEQINRGEWRMRPDARAHLAASRPVSATVLFDDDTGPSRALVADLRVDTDNNPFH